MDALIVVIVLLMMQFNGSIGWLQNDRWIRCWLSYSEQFPMGKLLHLVLGIGLPCFIVGGVYWFIADVFGSIAAFCAQIVILAYALGRGVFLRYLHEYIDLWQMRAFDKLPDFLSSYKQFIHKDDFATKDDDAVDIDTSTPLDALRMQGNRLFLEAAFQRWFVVLFWFLLINPIVALLYRLIVITRQYVAEKEDATIVAVLDRALFLMEWPMARLIALCFVVSGKVGEVFTHWCSAVLHVKTSNTDFLIDAAQVALAIEPVDEELNSDVIQDRATHDAKQIKLLVMRCLLLVVIVAVFL